MCPCEICFWLTSLDIKPKHFQITDDDLLWGTSSPPLVVPDIWVLLYICCLMSCSRLRKLYAAGCREQLWLTHEICILLAEHAFWILLNRVHLIVESQSLDQDSNSIYRTAQVCLSLTALSRLVQLHFIGLLHKNLMSVINVYVIIFSFL